ncbi:Uncharacterised protein [Escherichia coli]|uniref:Uncharacterized protein n=1 Tax=Escherichia coli TaxID=562 RepID=A0A376SAU2_ECOLX|nr:Uncharacterised protein [Escherichia coli]
MRGQTGEGVSHYVPVSGNLKMVAAAFCAMSFAQLAGWLPWVWRWGYNSKPHAHLACGCARPEP